MNTSSNAPFLRWMRCFFMLFFIHLSPLFSQNLTWNLQIIPKDSTAQKVLQNDKISASFSDSLSIQNYLNQFIEKRQNEGFFLASFDSIFIEKKQFRVHFLTGKKFEKLNIRNGNITSKTLQKVAISEKQIIRKITYPEFRKLGNQILEFHENHGYPFASIYLDSIEFINQQFSGTLQLDSGHFVLFDSTIIRGDIKLKTSFLDSYLKIPKGLAFDQRKLLEIENKLENLPYLELIQPVKTVFRNGKAYPIIYLKKQAVNEFNGLIGFLPNTSEIDQKLRIIGNLNLKLHNAFGRGILFRMALQIPKPRSRTLDAEFEYPNLVRTNLDINLKLNLFSEDTLFANWRQKYMLRYDAGKNKKIGLFIMRQTASPIDSVFTVNEITSKISETNYQAYGLNYTQNRTNRLFSPQKGFKIWAEMMFGNKQNTLEITNSTSEITNTSVQWILETDLQKFFKTGKQTTLLLRSRNGLILNKNLSVNELFRLGGFQTLRGFNENEFFASRYWTGTAEYRIYFGENSSLFTFLDGGFLDYKVDNQYFKDIPYGFGLGFMVGTKSGIFNFAYALGKSKIQKISMEQSKIHFGYVNRF